MYTELLSVIEKFQPDAFLLHAGLKFFTEHFQPTTCNVTLHVKFPFEDWIQFSPARYVHRRFRADMHDADEDSDDMPDEDEINTLMFRLEDELYGKLNEDKVVEWQLIFEEKLTRQKIGGPIVPIVLKKRPKGYDLLESSMHFSDGSKHDLFNLCKNGEFQYTLGIDSPEKDIRGRYTIDSESDNHIQMTIVPQTNLNQPIYKFKFSGSNTNHQIFSVPEILDIILDYVITTQDEAISLHNILGINLLCKEWYDSLRRVLKIRATLSKRRFLVVNHWLDISKCPDIKIYSKYSWDIDREDE